jgi:hydrogenase maturation protease
LSDQAETVVIGLGNLILSDDGLGVHAVRRLRKRYAFGGGVELIEGGTAGLVLLPVLADARCAILVDAIDTGTAPGTITRLEGRHWVSVFSMRLTPHDVALADLLGAAELIGAWPQTLVLLGAQPASVALGTELTAPVAGVLDALVDAIAAELIACSARRPRPIPRLPARPASQECPGCA